MDERIFAVISNLNGLSAQEKNTLTNMGCGVGSVYNVKEVLFKDADYEAVLDFHGIEVTLGSENLNLYKTYDGYDVIKYIPEPQNNAQKGE